MGLRTKNLDAGKRDEEEAPDPSQSSNRDGLEVAAAQWMGGQQPQTHSYCNWGW